MTFSPTMILITARGTVKSARFISPIPTRMPRLSLVPTMPHKREFSFDEKDNIVVKNPSAFWLPDVKIVDERFAMMSKNYTEEQKDLKAEVKGLQQQIHEQEQQAENIEQFVQRVKRNSTVTELTPLCPQRACQGGLCRCTGQVQRQAQAEEGTYRVRPCGLYSRG